MFQTINANTGYYKITVMGNTIKPSMGFKKKTLM